MSCLYYNGKSVMLSGTKWVSYNEGPVLPAFTMRFKFAETSYDPTNDSWGSGTTWTRVSSDPNIWDYKNENTSWGGAFSYSNLGSRFSTYDSIYVLGSNTSQVVSFEEAFHEIPNLVSVDYMHTESAGTMKKMFYMCNGLEHVGWMDTSNVTDMSYAFAATFSIGADFPLLDTSNVTDISHMFHASTISVLPPFDTSSVVDMSYFCAVDSYYMPLIRSIPAFDTSHVTNISHAFEGCEIVDSGALALYQSASTQSTPPSITTNCFSDCGIQSQTGLAELQQIPSSWGGLAP